MNTVNTRYTTGFQPILSLPARIASAVAVAGLLVLTAMTAQQASHQAVQTASESFAREPATVYALEPVQIVGRRTSADAKRI